MRSRVVPAGAAGTAWWWTGKPLAAVRLEFRQDAPGVRPGDLVPCRDALKVAGCGRTSRIKGPRFGHDHRRRSQGKPDRGEFYRHHRPRLKGAREAGVLPGFRLSIRAQGTRVLCTRHLYAWQRAGRPELDSWLAVLPAEALQDPPRRCPDSLL